MEESKPAQMPASQIKIKILENTYTIKLPTVGQFIDIQTYKVRLAGEEYDKLSSIYESDKAYAKLLIDLIACYTVLIPDFKKDLNVDSVSSLDLIKAKTLINTYIKEFLPWYLLILKFLGSSEEHEEVTKNIKETSSLSGPN